MRKFHCVLGVHDWRLLVTSKKHDLEKHDNPMAGCLAVCRGCGHTWDDVPRPANEDHAEDVPMLVSRAA